MTFDTSLLDQAVAAQKARWEEERRFLLARLLALLAELATQFSLKEVYVFGSLVQPGRFSDGSDIDVAVAELPSHDFFKLAAVLSARLGRDVDLVELNRCHFANKIRREGMLWTPSD